MTAESRRQLAPVCPWSDGHVWRFLDSSRTLSQLGWFHFRAMSIAEGAELKPLYVCIALALQSKSLRVNLVLEQLVEVLVIRVSIPCIINRAIIKQKQTRTQKQTKTPTSSASFTSL